MKKNYESDFRAKSAKKSAKINSDESNDDDEEEEESDAKSMNKKLLSKNSRREVDMESRDERERNEAKKRKQRNFVKQEHFFNFKDDVDDKENQYPQHIAEYGLSLHELEDLNAFYSLPQKILNKEHKKRRKLAKHYRNKNYFFTSKCYMLFHLLQNIMFWLIVFLFPMYSVISC